MDPASVSGLEGVDLSAHPSAAKLVSRCIEFFDEVQNLFVPPTFTTDPLLTSRGQTAGQRPRSSSKRRIRTRHIIL